MTDAIVCDRCGEAVPRDEWTHHTHATVEIGFVEYTDVGEYDRGPIELDLCGECTDWLDEACGKPAPTKWDRWSAGGGEGER